MSSIAFSPNGNSLRWFAAHEGRLIWRDFTSLVTGGKPQRIALVSTIVLIFAGLMHWFVAHLMRRAFEAGIAMDKSTLVLVSGLLAMLFLLMFSQAIESVTRAYYARSDMDLILSSPAASQRLFQVRTSVLAIQTITFSLLIAAPLINVLAYKDGPSWLFAYIVLIALGGIATGLALLMTLLLFRTVGTARTRLIAQIISAFVGAGFIIALQGAAVLYGEKFSRISILQSEKTIGLMPPVESWLWFPAKAAMGEIGSVILLLLIGMLFLSVIISYSARRFGADVLATAGLVHKRTQSTPFKGFGNNSNVRAVLRRKEWQLLKRDPWLMSQSLQQLLYLITPGLLLWVNYGIGHGVYYVVIPVVVMASGQLAGGLSWVTISGEDAHELIDTGPISTGTILRAKVEAVVAIIAIVVAPFMLAMILLSTRAAVCLAIGVFLATLCSVTIQLWFRSQANRSMFRRRQVSSKAATITEALVSVLWAVGSALMFYHGLLIIPSIVLVALAMGVVWYIRPRREV